MFSSWLLIFSYRFFKLELTVGWHVYLAGGWGLCVCTVRLKEGDVGDKLLSYMKYVPDYMFHVLDGYCSDAPAAGS